ncbi:hypothetical protein RJ639_019871 [Escallonia herrerae]|uniref:Golgin candidate 4 n=1 Tax=Escallonia herrerae TaxID=1293975 RepID=A0AA89AJJ9_9ASTE|nr:hypothetical protein RJ639_019871 [Escallonia herrerae]
MWTLASFKDNLNKIALDVHDDDDDDELSIYDSRGREDYSPPSDRRASRNSARSEFVSSSPFTNGFDSAANPEIEQYKAEIKRLQESEAEIKALSVNYAALLKEREEKISFLNQENGSLKQNLGATKAALNASRNESVKTSPRSPNMFKDSDQSPNRQHKAGWKNRSIGSPPQNGIVSKQNGLSNGIAHNSEPDVLQYKKEPGHVTVQGNEKELADLLKEKDRYLREMQASHETQIKQLGSELNNQRDKLATMQLRLQEEQKLNGAFKEELNLLKGDKDKSFADMSKIHDELNHKRLEISRLQVELNTRNTAYADDSIESLKRLIATLEKENTNLKMERDELQANLKANGNSSGTIDKLSNSASEQPPGSFAGKEEMESSLQKLQNDLKGALRERDKVLQELNRLKQHLLDKVAYPSFHESEESEKMDEDSRIIEELREKNEHQRAQMQHLEKALKQAIASQEDVKMMNNSELLKSKEVIDDLNRKLASCMSTIDSKNVELLNLQTALGQYYAEIEAKEHLEGDLALAREESSRLAELLKDAHQQSEVSKKEKEEILAKLSQAERMIAEGKARINKLEEDNAKLRRALEQSMSRLNRMSMDSDYFVDRRIVIKLLVTYFQRNHSKEVLDLMVRMLGFSDEDKQRIGGAQQGGGKGVVRGVLGLPGRLVGGILGGSSGEVSGNATSDNQSFADLWVDFLLKETEERERRESAEATYAPKQDQHEGSPNTTGTASPMNDRTTAAGFSRLKSPPDQNQSSLPSRGNFIQSEHSEFSTVPLTSSDSNSRMSRLFPRY